MKFVSHDFSFQFPVALVTESAIQHLESLRTVLRGRTKYLRKL
jgi:hypothetical protein